MAARKGLRLRAVRDRALSGERLSILGFPLDPLNIEGAVHQLQTWASGGQRGRTVITLNPEIIVQAQSNPTLRAAIEQADLITADGVGIVWAARRLHGVSVPRATGIDLATELMKAGGPDMSVYFLGGRPGVAEAAADNARRRFGVRVAGVQHGYFSLSEESRVMESIVEARPDVLLTGLGAGRQETFNEGLRASGAFGVGLGVGGTLDVLAGIVQRAPAVTTRLGLEWLWRIITMRRWIRAARLAKFAGLVLAHKRT